QGKEDFLQILHRYMEVHGTVYYETQRPPEVPAFVKNHGLLPQHELQQLLRKAKLFIGFGFPYEGPAPLEAIANGCIFLQPKFQPPHSSLNHEFFRGKPTSREVTSQHAPPPPASFYITASRPPTPPPCLYAGVLTAPVRGRAHRQTARHDGGLQQLPRVRICHQGNLEDEGTLAED
ncbi:unnamed protein product, partial [Tetraodon nigroviridis]